MANRNTEVPPKKKSLDLRISCNIHHFIDIPIRIIAAPTRIAQNMSKKNLTVSIGL